MERLSRLAALSLLAATAALAATAHVPVTHASTQASPTDGFAGPVSSAPRALDRDLEAGTRGGLRRVACAGSGSARCWIVSG